ncbi:hypothetical protein NC651_014419 [Populus alba x Populus x berolinensis]|nr:hypothetical protein NC651_014419 [Populus alba x Populus x berolinensis]
MLLIILVHYRLPFLDTMEVKRHCSSPRHIVENLPFKAFDISNSLVLCVFKQVPVKPYMVTRSSHAEYIPSTCCNVYMYMGVKGSIKCENQPQIKV